MAMADVIATGYTIYSTDGSVSHGSVDWPKEPGYDLINQFMRATLFPDIDGTNWEHVSVLNKDQSADMFVDDGGDIKHLTRNEAATAIYRANWLRNHHRTDPEALSAIYGPAIVFDRRIWY